MEVRERRGETVCILEMESFDFGWSWTDGLNIPRMSLSRVWRIHRATDFSLKKSSLATAS